eukprot:TRINITY_DN19606_c0_g1_i1.p1 TRINITY_DN19606_c0_g1~~TRINITY_DN19606_c0_g1_i1.p1  ORF type:complete len:316 (+),score=65.40 TRINITY_DN19606_c0_g1_i1:221-1168(+)
MTAGIELGGNKVRKLEVVLADALEGGCDTVITAGGMQSNHCRATVSAARMLGMRAIVVLRIDDFDQQDTDDPGVKGNLLISRLCGAEIHIVSRETYMQYGGFAKVLDEVERKVRSEGGKPYVVPLGGSNAAGTWGYLSAVDEMRSQCEGIGVTDIAVATGSGGTAVGIALGCRLSGWDVKVHAFGMNDTPDWHYKHADEAVIGELLAEPDAGLSARNIMEVTQAKGEGYARSTVEELRWLREAAAGTGLILDPCYSGKALRGLVHKMRAAPESFKGRKVLFVHTGGALGMWAKEKAVQPLCGQTRRLVAGERSKQ